jgi:hypothetical protein
MAQYLGLQRMRYVEGGLGTVTVQYLDSISSHTCLGVVSLDDGW